jgi:hypothetical protein
MLVAAVTPSDPTTPARVRLTRSPMAAPAASSPNSRALAVSSFAPGNGTGPAGQRPSAAFLAQLIATAQQAPQTRQRRRAEPSEVNAIYAAASAPAAWLGRAIYRAM